MGRALVRDKRSLRQPAAEPQATFRWFVSALWRLAPPSSSSVFCALLATFVDPIVANTSLDLQADAGVLARLPEMARGRPLVIDYWVARQRGITVGDLQMAFADPPDEPRFARAEPIGGVEALVAIPLIPVIRGATLELVGLPFRRHLGLILRRNEEWIDFLEQHRPLT